MPITPSVSPVALGYLTFAMPFLTFHLCWVISMMQGVFEPCLPYWADCVSISHTGRHGLAYFVFKGGILPTAVLLIIFWHLNRVWLRSLDCWDVKALSILATIGALALIAYTLALGHSGDSFRLTRRFGVVLFMFCMFIAQVLLGRSLSQSQATPIAMAGKRLLSLNAFTLGVAVISLILDAILGDTYDRIEDAFEWWLIMLLLFHLLCVARLWRTSGFKLEAVTS